MEKLTQTRFLGEKDSQSTIKYIKEVRKMLRSKKAQSTLEYIIVFTVIVAAILLAGNTFLRTRVNNILDHASGQAETAVNQINFEPAATQ
jgi:uncharacterized protein (UPF0333 family)